jgi:hypothetical protein
MPIVVEAVSLDEYCLYINERLNNARN